MEFINDMLPGWSPGLSLGRKNNDGPYSPSNCRWETAKQQMRNTRQNRILRHKGLSLTIVEWSERVGINQKMIAMRLWQGWSVSRALTTLPVKPKTLSLDGQSKTLREWSDYTGLSVACIQMRLGKYKWPLKRALETPSQSKVKA